LPFLDLGRPRAPLDGSNGGDGQEIVLCRKRLAAKTSGLLCLTAAAKNPKTRNLLLESESMTCTVATALFMSLAGQDQCFSIKIIFNFQQTLFSIKNNLLVDKSSCVYISVLWFLI
jgi:hypothetical protein